MDTFNKLLKFDNCLPYLFIGSGFSRRYLGTPDWIGLLKYFCDMLHPENPLAFSELQNRAKQQLKNNNITESTNTLNCTIADLLETEFNSAWYNSSAFEDNRKKYASIILSTSVTPFKIEIAEYFKSYLSKPHLLTEELEKLKAISVNSIAGIMTTNYDCLIEEYFHYKKYNSQEELLFSKTEELCEIYKLHGCTSDPKSIIINSDDYEQITNKRKYLAAKLLTIFVEHPIIFIGYSISDEYICSILNDIVTCLNKEQLELFKSRLIFIDRLSPNEPDVFKIEEMNVIMQSKSIPMKKILLKDYGMLYEALAQNRTKYPVRILRALKQDIYKLVATNDPENKLRIMLPMENLENFSNVEYVIGVGVSDMPERSYQTYQAEDIFLDIIFDDKNFNNNLLVDYTLPIHLSRTSGSMPIYKYLSQYNGAVLPDIYKYYIEKSSTIEDLYSATFKKQRTTSYGNSIKEISTTYEQNKALRYIALLPPDKISLNELHDFLYTALYGYKDKINTGQSHSSDFRRLIKIYDWLAYHDTFAKKKLACNQ